MIDWDRFGLLLWNNYNAVDGSSSRLRKDGSFEWCEGRRGACLSDGYRREVVARGMEFDLSKSDYCNRVNVFGITIGGVLGVSVYRYSGPDAGRVLVPECVPVLEEMYRVLVEDNEAGKLQWEKRRLDDAASRAEEKRATVREWVAEHGQAPRPRSA